MRVGLLLPLSGPSASLGASLLDSAQLALFEAGDDRLVLIPRDTRGTAQGATAAARAVLDDGAQIIVGPLFAGSTRAVAEITTARTTPVLALTSDHSAGRIGVWTLGFAPRDEVARVASYAAGQGLRRFSALVPVGPYGDQVAAALEDTLRRVAGTLVRVRRFEPGRDDLRAALAQSVGGTGAVGPTGPARLRPDEVDVDALLIAEGGQRLREIGNMMSGLGLAEGQVQLLGTGLWDDRGAATNSPSLVGGWFAAPDPANRRAFEQRFATLYQRESPRIGTVVYDAVALAARLGRERAVDIFAASVLTNPDGHAGTDGRWRLMPDGEVERALAVLRITPGGIDVQDPAPNDFLQRLN